MSSSVGLLCIEQFLGQFCDLVIPSCNLCRGELLYPWQSLAGRELADEVAELREVFGDGLVGVFGGFVFEDDVASVFSGFQDLDEASQVRRDLLALGVAEFDLELDGRRVGGGAFKGGVGVLVGEVAGVQVHREPGGLHPFYNCSKAA